MYDALPGIFKDLPPSDVQEAMGYFQSVEVEAGFRLMEEGDDDASLVVVQNGELIISTAGTRLGRANAGDVVGEMALFGSGMRTATVDAATDSKLLLLDVPGYQALRDVGHPVAAAIEDHALSQLTGRLRATSQRIAQLAKGTDTHHTLPTAGFFDRMASAFGTGGLFADRIDKAAVLADSPLFAGVPPEILAEVAACFYVVGARRGQFLCTQGETGNDMYIMASGKVDVVVAVSGERAQHLATLERGEAFGMCALLHPNQPRMASCVTRESAVALTMGKIAFAEITGRHDIVGSVIRVAMIRALADQLAYANGQLSQLDLRRVQLESNDPMRSAELLRNAVAAVEAHGAYVARAARDTAAVGEP